jgi:hypothetical protein
MRFFPQSSTVPLVMRHRGRLCESRYVISPGARARSHGVSLKEGEAGSRENVTTESLPSLLWYRGVLPIGVERAAFASIVLKFVVNVAVVGALDLSGPWISVPTVFLCSHTKFGQIRTHGSLPRPGGSGLQYDNSIEFYGITTPGYSEDLGNLSSQVQNLKQRSSTARIMYIDEICKYFAWRRPGYVKHFSDSIQSLYRVVIREI